MPATGVVNDLKTTSQLRPGIEKDTLKVPIYQVDDFKEAENRPVFLYEYIGDIVITGEEVERIIPSDSAVDVTLKVDTSEQMILEAHFPAADITIEKPLDTSKKQSIEDAERDIKKGIAEAIKSIRRLKESNISTCQVEKQLEQVQAEAEQSSEKKMVLQHLKEVLRNIEDLDESTEWQRVEEELRSEFDKLENAQSELGNEETGGKIEQLRTQVDQAIRTKDVKVGREMLEQVNSLFFQMTLMYQCIALIEHYNNTFAVHPWKDVSRARQLINRGLEVINNAPSTESLLPIARGIVELLPDQGGANAGGLLR